MVLEKPQRPREWLLQEFESIKAKKQKKLLNDKDFEAIFQNYNVFNKDWVPSRFLPQGTLINTPFLTSTVALGLCGIKNATALADEKYSEVLASNRLSKSEFIEILKLEYKINGFEE